MNQSVALPGETLTGYTVALNTADAAIARRPVLVGYLITLAFVAGVFLWAAFAPISSAAIAPGVLGQEGYRKTVQHLEGGIVHEIRIREGDQVAAGQVLIELADLQSRSDFQLLEKQKYIAGAKEACLMAAQTDADTVRLPDWLDLDAADASVRDAIEGQIEATLLERKLHQEQLANLTRQAERARAKSWALRQERDALANTVELVKAELAQYEEMQAQGLVTRQVVFDLRRQLAEKEAEFSANRVAMQTNAQELNELELKRNTLDSARVNRIGEQLDRVRAELVMLDEKLAQTGDTLERTLIRAPADGTVLNLRVNTVGGVVQPGEPLLDIVPEEGRLIVEARVDPLDRDTVAVGQDAEIRFSAFNRRVTQPVAGRVMLISADRLLDTVSKEPYYLAKIELTEDPEQVLGGGQVYPGMQAEVFIITGNRTALSYLVDPVVKSFNRAFREE